MPNQLLQGKKGIVMGLANEQSIAWGCAKALYDQGAEVLMAYGHPKSEKFVKPLAESINSPMMFCDVTSESDMHALFDQAQTLWGEIDFVVHSLAFCPMEDLHGRTIDCSAEGFSTAMQISCHSFLHAAKLAEPLMKNGGALITMSYYGADKVIPHYNAMGPVKAALESCVRYAAVELGENNIRCYAVSPGPIQTRAASGIAGFDGLLNKTSAEAPLNHNVSIADIGNVSASLVSDLSAAMTGQTIYVDSGYHNLGCYGV